MIMKKQDLTDYHDKYIEAAKLQGESIQAGDSKTANRQYTILKRIFIKAQKDINAAKIFYKNLRSNAEPNVKLWACAHSLALGIDVDEAENILNNLSQNEEIGILSLNAEMTLKVWKKQGYLRF
jgi:hypothetical protein